MKIIYDPICLEYSKSGHPESPSRVERIYESLKNNHQFLKPEKVTEGDIEKVHTKEHWKNVREGKYFDWDTPVIDIKYPLVSAGSAIKAAQVLGFSLSRPPGHHAKKQAVGGFCYFNNLAIAVAKILPKYEKIAIIDFDNHCGDGTSDIFYSNPNVLYISLHQYPSYPGTGWVDEIGEGRGEGFNINFPLPLNTGDDIYFDSFNKILQILDQFKPNLVALSAGFDAHWSDPITQMNISTNTYYEIGRLVANKFPRIFGVLEGGYNLDWLPKCAVSFFDGLEKRSNPTFEEIRKSEISVWTQYQERLRKIKGVLSDHWVL